MEGSPIIPISSFISSSSVICFSSYCFSSWSIIYLFLKDRRNALRLWVFCTTLRFFLKVCDLPVNLSPGLLESGGSPELRPSALISARAANRYGMKPNIFLFITFSSCFHVWSILVFFSSFLFSVFRAVTFQTERTSSQRDKYPFFLRLCRKLGNIILPLLFRILWVACHRSYGF